MALRLIGAMNYVGGLARPPASTADMTVEEAYAVLGLQPDADEAAVRKAHRRLIKQLHTDQGGTDYLASKINRARDVLLRHIAGRAHHRTSPKTGKEHDAPPQ